MMKRGISRWAFAPERSPDEVFALASEAGFEGIELSYGTDDWLNPASETQDAKKILRIAAEKNLTVSSLASGIFWSVNLLSEDDAERSAAKGHVRRMLEIAADLEVGTILVVPGFIGPFEAGAPALADYDAAFERAALDFAELGKTAEKLGVSIGIENVWNKFLSSAFEMRAFLDRIGSSHVGCYFDVGNVLRTAYPEQWIRMLGGRIKGVHFKDFRISVGNLQGFVDLGEGDVDFSEVMRALLETGYDGYCVAELFVRPNDPDAVALRAGADMRRIFQRAGLI